MYLDFKDWVAMANAALGKPEQPAHIGALEIARFGVDQGLLEFPISAMTYMELLQKRDAKRREEVGAVIVELSGLRSMAPIDLLLPEEIDRALKSRFGRPTTVRQHPVWGRGVGHAFGEPDFEFTLPSRLDDLDEVTKLRLIDRYTKMTERAMLQGPSEASGVGEVPGVESARELVERHARGEAELGDIIRGNFPGGPRFRDAWIARALIELVDDLTEAELRANVPGRRTPRCHDGANARSRGNLRLCALMLRRWRTAFG